MEAKRQTTLLSNGDQEIDFQSENCAPNQQKDFICCYCLKEGQEITANFGTCKELRTHLAQDHIGAAPFKCPHCVRFGSSAEVIFDHCESAHPGLQTGVISNLDKNCRTILDNMLEQCLKHTMTKLACSEKSTVPAEVGKRKRSSSTEPERGACSRLSLPLEKQEKLETNSDQSRKSTESVENFDIEAYFKDNDSIMKRKLRCKVCDGIVPDSFNAKSYHIRKYHLSGDSYKCSECDFTSRSHNSSFYSHKRKHHGGMENVKLIDLWVNRSIEKPAIAEQCFGKKLNKNSKQYKKATEEIDQLIMDEVWVDQEMKKWRDLQNLDPALGQGLGTDEITAEKQFSENPEKSSENVENFTDAATENRDSNADTESIQFEDYVAQMNKDSEPEAKPTETSVDIVKITAEVMAILGEKSISKDKSTESSTEVVETEANMADKSESKIDEIQLKSPAPEAIENLKSVEIDTATEKNCTEKQIDLLEKSINSKRGYDIKLTCKVCSREIRKNLACLEAHIRTKHIGNDTVRCGHCEFSHKMKSVISTHCKKQHPDEAVESDDLLTESEMKEFLKEIFGNEALKTVQNTEKLKA